VKSAQRFAAALALWLLGACTVGNGEGAAVGKLYLNNCYGTGPNDSFGAPDQPWDFNLNANFFSGEPIEDIKPNGSDNRLLIRMQGSGTRIEDSDLLVFDMDSWPVAQCVRGDPRVLATPELQRFCARDPATGLAKVRVGPGLPVRVNMALRKRCPANPYVVATARDITAGQAGATSEAWTSYVRFREFGDAARTNVQPTFKVEFGQMLEAESFALDMLDDQTVRAQYEVRTPASKPVPDPQVRAALTGRFKFELQRGQGAQTFP
jgi:hypothetical protein